MLKQFIPSVPNLVKICVADIISAKNKMPNASHTHTHTHQELQLQILSDFSYSSLKGNYFTLHGYFSPL